MASVALFANQEKLVGVIAAAVPQLGDITFFVGFVLAAAGYIVLCRKKLAVQTE